MKGKYIASSLAAVAALVTGSVTVGQPISAIGQGNDPATVVSRYGAIVDSRPVGVGELTAWTVEKNGHKVVLYTTADAQAIFTGVVWEAATGHNLSDQFITNYSKSKIEVQSPIVTQSAFLEQQEIRPVAAFDGKFTGTIPESMKTVDSLAGFKEGKGGIADTLYIIVDPRCPYCRKAYNITRNYVNKGYTIKWIPTVALGDPANGLPLAAVILQSKDKELIDQVLGKHKQIKVQPTKETEEALSINLAFMQAAFEQNGGQQAGVPVAFYIDRRTGKPRMMTGVSEMVVLEDIFGKL